MLFQIITMKRTKEEAELTKKKLLNIALRQLVKNGFENVTLENIAAKAGVTRGAIYWHFNNKEDLLDYLIKTKDIESLEIMDIIMTSDASPLEKIYNMVSVHFPVFKTRAEMKNFARLKMDIYNYYLKFGDNRNIGKTYTKNITLLIKQAQAERKIKKNVDAGEAAYTIFSLIGGVYLRFNQSNSNYNTLKKLYKLIESYIKQIET